jgi:hypothetical protein
MEQPVQIIYHYQRSENVDGIVVNLTMSTPSLEALKHDLRNLPQYSMIELETHDLWQINRRPGFWDKVDQAYDHAKDNTT